MSHRIWENYWVRLSVVSTLAGLLYSSWPLGYVLNPSVSRSGLASALEALHQPFNWVFIGGDVLSSVLMLIVCWYLWRRSRSSVYPRFLAIVLINVVIFSFGTIIDALLPERCQPTVASCPSWHVDHLLLAHGIFSIAASFCLFLAVAVIWWKNRNPQLTSLMLGYAIFGVLTLQSAVSPTQSNFSQHYFITLTSIAMALIPYGVQRSLAKPPPSGSSKKSKS